MPPEKDLIHDYLFITQYSLTIGQHSLFIIRVHSSHSLFLTHCSSLIVRCYFVLSIFLSLVEFCVLPISTKMFCEGVSYGENF